MLNTIILLLIASWWNECHSIGGNYTVIYKNKLLSENEKITLSKPIGQYRVIDAFPFNGEPAVHLRTNYLEDVVDLFLVVDAWYTHSGFLKSSLSVETESHWFTNLNEQGKLLTVIIHKFPCDVTAAEVKPDTVDKSDDSLAWQRERWQRNIISEVLINHVNETEQYVLMSMDADEIPRKEAVKEYVKSYSQLNDGIRLKMMFFYYSFKWIKDDEWSKAAVVNDYFVHHTNPLTALNDLRLRNDRGVKYRDDQGWHCSYCMSPAKILAKTKGFSHASMFDPNVINLNWVTHCVHNGVDILNRTAAWDVLNLYDGRRGVPTCRSCHVFHTYE